jgi:hypothetical protein
MVYPRTSALFLAHKACAAALPRQIPSRGSKGRAAHPTAVLIDQGVCVHLARYCRGERPRRRNGIPAGEDTAGGGARPASGREFGPFRVVRVPRNGAQSAEETYPGLKETCPGLEETCPGLAAGNGMRPSESGGG